jgi:uncharacterized membrane-anchored protein YitT (DUF2179 family)
MWRNEIKRYLMITLGSVICSAAINAFFVPNSMLSGGVSGISLILYYLLDIPMSVTNIFFNVPLFIVAYRLMDRGYILASLYGMFAFAFTLDAFRFLADMRLTNDLLVAALIGGLGNGLGSALMYRVNAGAGGLDIVAGGLNKFYGISYGTVNLIANSAIMLVSVFFFGLPRTVYTFIGMYIAARATDKVTAGFDNKKSITIISPENNAIAAEICKEVGRGVTFLFGEGAYTGQKRKIIFVVIKLTQISKIKAIVHRHDPTAFMMVQEAVDVLGKGFTMKNDIEVQKDIKKQAVQKRLRHINQLHKERLRKEAMQVHDYPPD